MTLFHFMVVNNWFVTIDMYRAVMDEPIIPVIFFVTFWCFVVLILLNVVLSLVLEIYSSVEPEVKRVDEKVKLIKKIRHIIESTDQ